MLDSILIPAKMEDFSLLPFFAGPGVWFGLWFDVRFPAAVIGKRRAVLPDKTVGLSCQMISQEKYE